MPDTTVAPLFVAILGTDVLHAAGPVAPVQLMRACELAGFDFVAPVSLGDELIATYVAGRAGEGSPVTIASSCPLVAEELRRSHVDSFVVETVSPPEACARVLRAAFAPRRIHVTFFGACAGAGPPDVDAQHLPDALFARLEESGIDPARQPRVFENRLPAEMARYASLPGGMPDDSLLAASGARLVEAAIATTAVLGRVHPEERLLVDLARSCGCRCARDRVTVSRAEPPRSATPVVTLTVAVATTTAPEPEQTVDDEPAMPRATFAQDGLSKGEVNLPTAPQDPFTTSREPW